MKLSDKFKRWISEQGFSRSTGTIAKLTEEVEELEKEKWIDASISLPSPLATVLIWTTVSLNPDLGFYTGSNWLYFSANGNFWIDKEPHIKILYWHPLPDIPTKILKQ